MLCLSNPFLECNFQDNIFYHKFTDKRYKCPFSIKAFAVFFHELITHCQFFFSQCMCKLLFSWFHSIIPHFSDRYIPKFFFSFWFLNVTFEILQKISFIENKTILIPHIFLREKPPGSALFSFQVLLPCKIRSGFVACCYLQAY